LLTSEKSVAVLSGLVRHVRDEFHQGLAQTAKCLREQPGMQQSNILSIPNVSIRLLEKHGIAIL
jgi:hypothetical protein